MKKLASLLALVVTVSAPLVFLPSKAVAKVCAIQYQGAVSGNYVSNSYTDPYGPAFTVSSDCDITGIQLYTGNDGTAGTWQGVIYDNSGTVLVTGGASPSITTTWNSCMYATSTIAAGTYTLTSGNTYHVGMAINASGHIRQCMSTTGTNQIMYYPAGGPWTNWVVQYPAYVVTGADAAPASAPVSQGRSYMFWW